MTTLLVVILHDADRLPDLIDTWSKIGVGATILPSMGGYMAASWARRSGLGGLLNLFEQGRSQQRTLLCLIEGEELLEQAIAEADKVVKGFDRPHSGILFTLPVGEITGLKKWAPAPAAEEETEAAPLPEDRSLANLTQWFYEDLKSHVGEERVESLSAMRSAPVSDIVDTLKLKPAVVQMNAPLEEVVRELIAHPQVPVVCVVNTENRLMGTLDLLSLADATMIGVLPEEFLGNPQDYEKALRYARKGQAQIAAEIIRDPVQVHMEDTLETAFHLMHKYHLDGLPVVDKRYRLVGYISLMEVLAVCFGK